MRPRAITIVNEKDAGVLNDGGASVFRILALKLIIEAPEKNGYRLTTSDYYQPVEYKAIFINESIQDLPQFAKSLEVSYQTLKQHNPWIQNTDYKLVLKEGKKYKIRIPVKKD